MTTFMWFNICHCHITTKQINFLTDNVFTPLIKYSMEVQ
jgi:hypothetical protein